MTANKTVNPPGMFSPDKYFSLSKTQFLSNYDQFCDILCITIESIFNGQFCDSVCDSVIVEIIAT